MPRGKMLSVAEKAKIDAFKTAGWSNRRIAQKLGRTHSLINQYTKNPLGYGTKAHTGRPRMHSKQDERRICRLSSNSVQTLDGIRGEMGLSASLSTVWRVVHRSGYLKNESMKAAPRLKVEHKADRLQFVRDNMATDWEKVTHF